MGIFHALNSKRNFHGLEFGDLFPQFIQFVFSQLILNESRVSLSGAAKGDNPAVVFLRILKAVLDIVQFSLLRGTIATSPFKA